MLVVQPAELEVSAPSRDERNPGRLKLELEFTLPRGSYATMLIKRLFADEPRPRLAGDGPRPHRPQRPHRPHNVGSRPRWQNEP